MNNQIDDSMIAKRLKAVLSYDGIDDKQMHLYLAKLLNVSSQVAKRMLVGKSSILRRISNSVEIAEALDVSYAWLFLGELVRYHNRTMRIHMQAYKGYPKEIVDKAMRFNFAMIAGQTKALNLFKLVSDNKLNYVDALKIH